MGHSHKLKTFSLLFLSSLCWGPSFLFIKFALPSFPPFTLVFWRVVIGFFFIYLYCKILRHKIAPWLHYWKECAILGITLNVLPFYLISFGEEYISSSLTSILNCFTLIFTAIIAHYFGAHEPITKKRALGIFSGIMGLVILYLPLVLHEGMKSVFGAILVVIATLCYGIGNVYAKFHLQRVPATVALTLQLLISAIILLPLSLFIDHSYALPFPSTQSILGVLGLGILGTFIAYYLYYQAMKCGGATFASLSVLLIPIFATILGAVVLHEEITWNLYLGAFFILAGILGVKPSGKKA